MNILGTLVIGLIVGVLAKLLTPGRDPVGGLITVALGIAGAFLVPYLGQTLHWYAPTRNAEFVVAAAGAILLILIYRAFRNKPD